MGKKKPNRGGKCKRCKVEFVRRNAHFDEYSCTICGYRYGLVDAMWLIQQMNMPRYDVSEMYREGRRKYTVES